MKNQHEKREDAQSRTITSILEFNRVYFPNKIAEMEADEVNPFSLGVDAARNSIATIKTKYAKSASRKTK